MEDDPLSELLKDERLRERAAKFEAVLGPLTTPHLRAFVYYMIDPLLSVNLRDKDWVAKYEAEWPNLRARFRVRSDETA